MNFGVVELSPSPSDDVMSWVRLKLKPPVESISYSIWYVFQHLDMLGMDMWVHPYRVTVLCLCMLGVDFRARTRTRVKAIRAREGQWQG